MSAAYVQYAGDGVTRLFAVPFPYFAREHVQVSFDATVQSGVGWLNDGLVETSAAAPVGSVVDVRRVTPTGSSPVDFEDGSVLTESDLDLLAKYSGYLAEESRDYVIGALRLGPDGSYNADARRMSNLADGSQPGDAMTVRQFTTQVDGPIAAMTASAQASATSAAGSAASATTNATAALGVAASTAVQSIGADLAGLAYMGSDLGSVADATTAPGAQPIGAIKTVANDIAAVRLLALRPDVILSGPGLVTALDSATNSAVAAAASAQIALGASQSVVDAASAPEVHYVILGATATGAVVRKTSANFRFTPATGLLAATKFAGDGSSLTNIGQTSLAATLDLGSIT